VVFPTPPLPATIRTRLWLQKALISMTPWSVVSDLAVGARECHDECRWPSSR
jgi:hypothetical protein